MTTRKPSAGKRERWVIDQHGVQRLGHRIPGQEERAEMMRFYCAECFEQMGNCLPWCSETANLFPLGRIEPEPEDADNDPDQVLSDGEAET